jgi:hypothetical protein
VLDLGLRRAELRDFHRALANHHGIRIRVTVLTLEHEPLGHTTDEVLDGQVNIDADAEVTRSLTLTFLDRRRAMDFDSDSPSNGALYANRMLRVAYEVRVDALGDWVNVPVFTGPITKLDRTGDEVTVECQGKELLALSQAWEPMTVKKGVNKVDAIRRILRERAGETRFDFPDLAAKLPKAVSLGRDSQPWLVAQKIADSLNRQLFYDGRGVCRMRRFPGNTTYTFTDGPRGDVMSPPQVVFSIDEVANTVWVKGGKPKAKKSKDEPQPQDDDKKEKERGVRHAETAPRSHPLSPWRLGRNGEPRYLLHVVENDAIRNEKEAREVAQRVLRRKLRQLVEVTFDSLPTPHLEPEDLLRINTDHVGQVVRLGQMSIPLRHDGTQSVGYLRHVSLTRRRDRK